jgi:hypothetical protein
MKTKIAFALLTGVAAIAMMQCGQDADPNGQPAEPVSTIIPVDLPTNIVPGFNFPEDSNAIYRWLNAGTGVDSFKLDSIYQHVWGIWAGLTAPTDQIYQGDTLLVFETWLSPAELAKAIQLKTDSGAADLLKTKSGRTLLNVPHQFSHAALMMTNPDDTFSTEKNVFEAVAYNLPAAEYALSKSIFRQNVIDSFYKANGIGVIPAFPSNAITTKPHYFAAKPTSNLIQIPVWPGIPDPPKAYDFPAWGTYVYADTTNSQQPGKVLVPVTITDPNTKPTQAEIDAATCNLTDFIYFKMDSAMAAYMNEFSDGAQSLQGGDVAILMGMHVGTKEISNWTWQTYYWDPTPASPKLPGTNMSKPSQITGAAAHYSAAQAYAMLAPLQPISGGQNDPSFKSVIAFNPYLEAGFGPGVFSGVKNNYNQAFQYGVQTNCMSCHAMAAYKKGVPVNSQFNYSTDQYIDMNDTSLFAGKVQLDFAWSILANLIPEGSGSK